VCAGDGAGQSVGPTHFLLLARHLQMVSVAVWAHVIVHRAAHPASTAVARPGLATVVGQPPLPRRRQENRVSCCDADHAQPAARTSAETADHAKGGQPPSSCDTSISPPPRPPPKGTDRQREPRRGAGARSGLWAEAGPCPQDRTHARTHAPVLVVPNVLIFAAVTA
jgi:hypothetical protein